ncbi:MAG: hypothetical protein KDJ14_08765 [Xanthomonadales bacterium]|nr:hypothetical protein [Xanthomonadales bacterium]
MLDGASDNALAWRYTAERGGHWRMRLDATQPAAPGSYRIEGVLERLD